MPEPSFNDQIISEFRANAGVVGGPFEGASIVLMHTTGAKSGATYVTPVVYRRDGDRLLVFASAAGAPRHPAWFHNLVAHPEITVELGEDGRIATRTARVENLEGEERDRLYAQQAADVVAFREYQEKTDRTIPVLALHVGDEVTR